MNKRMLALCLILVLAFSSAGCGKKSAAGGAAANTAGNTAGNTADAAGNTSAAAASGNAAGNAAANTAASADLSKEVQKTVNLSLNTVMMAVGSHKVTYQEVVVYLLWMKAEYEPVYGDQVWSLLTGQTGSDGQKQTFGEYVKDRIVDQIAQVKILNDVAKKEKITLDADEERDLSSAVAKYFNTLDKDVIDRYQLTQDVILTVYRENRIAEDVFETKAGEAVDTSNPESLNQILDNTANLAANTASDAAGNTTGSASVTNTANAAANSASDTMTADHANTTGDGNTTDNSAENLAAQEKAQEEAEDAAIAAANAAANAKILAAQKAAFRTMYAEWSKDVKVLKYTVTWNSVNFTL